MKQRMLQVLDETVEYYSKDPDNLRGLENKGYDDQHCGYLTTAGTMCAVGRCMVDPTEFIGKNMPVGRLPDLDDRLKPDYVGLPIHFWRSLQYLHDKDDYWCQNGLTPDGIEGVKELRKHIQEGYVK